MSDAGPIVLRNPMRYIVPIGTAVLTVVMFIIPVILIGSPSATPGLVALGLIVGWLLYAAWRAPHALRLESGAVTIDRLSGEHVYGFDQVRKWWFAIPDGLPTQSPPASNGVLYVVFVDRTKFRGEVTADEATHIARLLTTK